MCIRESENQTLLLVNTASRGKSAGGTALFYNIGLNHFGYNRIRILLAVLLLTAAGLKGYQLATSPVLGSGLLDSRWLLIATVEFELFFGLWLLSGLLPRLTWMAAVGCFGLFAAVSLYKAVSGEASCGCFGPVEVNPWYTFSFDVVAVGLLLWFWPKQKLEFGEILHHNQRLLVRLLVVAVVWLILAVPTTYAIVFTAKSDLTAIGSEFVAINGKKIISVEPEKWIGKPLPLLPYIKCCDNLTNGVWLILLYKHKCPVCIEAKGEFRDLSEEFLNRNNCPRIAVIDTPPYDKNTSGNSSKDSCSYGKLQSLADQKWMVHATLVLLVDQGKVQRVFDYPQDRELIRAIWGVAN